MMRCAMLIGLCTLVACQPTQDIDEDARDAVDAGGPPGVAMPHLTQASVYPTCSPDGLGAVVVVLSATPGCVVPEAADRIELTVMEGANLPFPLAAPLRLPVGLGAPVQARLLRGGAAQPIVAGELTLERFSIHGAAEGHYTLALADADPLEGDFTADICTADRLPGGDGRDCYPYVPRPEPEPEVVPEPEPEPEPEVVPEPDPEGPPGVCTGTYTVTAWTIDEVAFSPEFVNDAIDQNLLQGDLLLDLTFSAAPLQVQVVDAVANNGQRLPDPAVPPSAPIGLAQGADGIVRTVQPAAVQILIGPFGPDGTYAPATVFYLEQTAIEGTFSNDCDQFEGRLTGAFIDRPEYTIPARFDTDTDGDGTLDGWSVGSALRATRQPD